MEKINERYMFGEENGYICVIADGKRYILTCHPYEPCLFITDETGIKTAVHNAFDPAVVSECFREGKTITSISGMEYDKNDFCEMVEYAAGMGDIGIEMAEEVFKDRPKKKNPEKLLQKENNTEDNYTFCPPIDRDTGCVVDYCIVKNEHLSDDYNSHWLALAIACGELFTDDGEPVWQYSIGKAKAKKVDTCELFAPIEKSDRFNYKKAFLDPPYGCDYTEKDFNAVNEKLFPNGTDELTVYEWTTEWSDYFDDGHEWWGTLCYTVYDKTLNRFCVILASATD